jgi:hypothetical protein
MWNFGRFRRPILFFTYLIGATVAYLARVELSKVFSYRFIDRRPL